VVLMTTITAACDQLHAQHKATAADSSSARNSQHEAVRQGPSAFESSKELGTVLSDLHPQCERQLDGNTRGETYKACASHVL
jgi:hypothetical protein